jgi:hypothetical protein
MKHGNEEARSIRSGGILDHLMIYVSFEVLTIIWVVTLCSAKTSRRFGGTHLLYLQGRRVSHGFHYLFDNFIVEYSVNSLHVISAHPRKAPLRVVHIFVTELYKSTN